MPEPTRLYFDSSVYLALLNSEPERATIVEALVEDAERESVRIFTSTITLAEVAFFRTAGDPLALSVMDEQIDALVRNPRITTHIEFSEAIAVRARQFVRSSEGRVATLSVLDAIHLASAAAANVDHFFAYDSDFGPFGRIVDFQISEPVVARPRLDFGPPPPD